MFFPSLFNDNVSFQAIVNRQERLIAMCDVLLLEGEEKKEASDKLFKAEHALLSLFKPKNFVGAKSYEVEHEKNFQVLCHSLNSHTNENVKNMTILETYSLMEMLKKKERNV